MSDPQNPNDADAPQYRKTPPGLIPWRPGQSGNPGGGKRKLDEGVRQLAKQWTPKAIARLGYWLESDSAKASVAAASILLDRAWGRAPQEHTISEELASQIERLSDTDRKLRLLDILSRAIAASPPGATVIDVPAEPLPVAEPADTSPSDEAVVGSVVGSGSPA